MAKNEPKAFLEVVLDQFSKVRKEDGAILVDEYVNAYEAIIVFFDYFGRLFSFITADVKSKIEILRKHRKGDAGQNYLSVRSMLEYEVNRNITIVKGPIPSASRTLLRLHRALDFIRLFFEKLSESQEHDKVSSIASDCYNQTLANFHPWLVRKGTALAMYALPNRACLLTKINDQATTTEADTLQLLANIVTVINPIYEETQSLYIKQDLLLLP
ncbi:Ceramide-1-phosphate transfer protein [Trichoplax sp. H2]|nr:Ceramide-1-phosphate transfer protein [Trichoplax sp. H2]|eukprot:RDD44254.1 Ceramide-1-phosphate transfer protein [Trichoplax sp. H2]